MSGQVRSIQAIQNLISGTQRSGQVRAWIRNTLTPFFSFGVDSIASGLLCQLTVSQIFNYIQLFVPLVTYYQLYELFTNRSSLYFIMCLIARNENTCSVRKIEIIDQRDNSHEIAVKLAIKIKQ